MMGIFNFLASITSGFFFKIAEETTMRSLFKTVFDPCLKEIFAPRETNLSVIGVLARSDPETI